MFHQASRSLAEAGMLLVAGGFARKLGFLDSTDAQVCAISALTFGAIIVTFEKYPTLL